MNNGCIAVPLPQERTESLMSAMQRQLAAMRAQHGAPTPIFGLQLCSPGFEEVANLIIHTRRAPEAGVGVVATANIQHISVMRHDPEFRAAMKSADIVTCDGFPVFRYAAYRGCKLESRTTGREIVAAIMEKPIEEHHRLFFVVDSEETSIALRQWAAQHGLTDRVAIEIPPRHFIDDNAYCTGLAGRMSAFAPSLLFLCVGAPRSEVFAYRYRALLPACWALCVGQSVRIVLGLNHTVPPIVEKLSIEWLWRMMLEPRRLTRRYTTCTIGFLAAVVEDSIGRRGLPS